MLLFCEAILREVTFDFFFQLFLDSEIFLRLDHTPKITNKYRFPQSSRLRQNHHQK